jgi:hypothetical protein
MKTDAALWQAINAYNIDKTDAILPFSRRLARDNGWAPDFAGRAIAEYKRFIYLVCVSGNTLTPSQEIDSVWHLHLLYTQDYWDRFCGGMLNRRIHHGPTQGGQTEAQKHLTCYHQTLDLYRQEFGEDPPGDCWPEDTARFAPRTTRYIDTRTHLILPKRQVFLCLSMVPVFALAGCGLGEPLPALPWAICVLVIAALVILNFPAIRKAGLVVYFLAIAWFVPLGAWALSESCAELMGKILGMPITPDIGGAVVAACIAAVLTWCHTTSKGNGRSNCSGSGCSSSGSDGGSGCGGGCGGD